MTEHNELRGENMVTQALLGGRMTEQDELTGVENLAEEELFW